MIPFNDTDNPNTTLCVTPCVSFPNGARKTLSAGIDIAGSIGANSAGHIFIIHNPTTGVSDLLFSASALNPKLPSGFTEFTAINGFITDENGYIRQGDWQEDGTFTLNIGLPAKLGIDLTYTHLERLPVPGKVTALLNVVAYGLNSGNPGFYVLVKDPDSWPTKGLTGIDIDTSSIFSKPAGINISQPVYCNTDGAGQIFVGSHASTAWNGTRMHLYLMGWKYPRSCGPTFSMATFGASLTLDRSACNWPVQGARRMQVGKSEHIYVTNFGREGCGSNVWLSEGWHTRMAAIRADAVLIDMTGDGNPPNASVAQSLANTYTVIDACRTARPDCAIFLLKMMKMPAAGEAVFSQLSSIHNNLGIVAANRSNVSIIDCYTVSGDPALHPLEWLDNYHPLWAGVSRAVIPTVSSNIYPLIV